MKVLYNLSLLIYSGMPNFAPLSNNCNVFTKDLKALIL